MVEKGNLLKSFRGKYKYSLDDKGRIFIPARWRKLLFPNNSSAIITPGVGKCLFLYPLKYWNKNVEKQLDELSSLDPAEGNVLRYFTHNAEDVMIDTQGRITIPQHLLEYAKLEKEVIIAGTRHRIEIWNCVEYEKEISKFDISSVKLPKIKL